MRRPHILRLVFSVLVVGLVGLAGSRLAHAQFTQNKSATIKIDSFKFPPQIQKGYHLFQAKCNECHGLDRSLKMSFSQSAWSLEVRRMHAMASSQFNSAQAEQIIAFLNYNQEHRKPPTQAIPPASSSDPVSVGRALYYSKSCDACHSIGGKGGTAGPALDNVGAKVSPEEMTKTLRQGRSGTAMLPVSPDTPDVQIRELVDFLMTLKGPAH